MKNNKEAMMRNCLIIIFLTVFSMQVLSSEDRSEAGFFNWIDQLVDHFRQGGRNDKFNIQLGPRPFFLIEDMDDSELKTALKQCQEGPFYKTDFSIAHRGAPLQFPEHTKESYEAGAKMGAGIIECDVTFTSDKELVCRHSQCDLHTTTNVLATELSTKCSEPFIPFDGVNPASAKCCTSDFTLEEFKSLCAKMDASDPYATTLAEYLGGTANYRTDLYSQCGTLMTHAESIELFKTLNVKMTPELKAPSVDMPYDTEYSQQVYAQHIIDEYKAAGVDPRNVYLQSFNLEDVLYWVENAPRFGKRAVYLDARVYQDSSFVATLSDFEALYARGIRYIAPPMFALLSLDQNQNLVASEYAILAKEAGLKIITWTIERSGSLAKGGGWYYQSVVEAINNDGDMFTVLDALAKQVEIEGIFSDWPATTTYYANCMGL